MLRTFKTSSLWQRTVHDCRGNVTRRLCGLTRHEETLATRLRGSWVWRLTTRAPRNPSHSDVVLNIMNQQLWTPNIDDLMLAVRQLPSSRINCHHETFCVAPATLLGPCATFQGKFYTPHTLQGPAFKLGKRCSGIVDTLGWCARRLTST